jgi:hypothetical protein
MGRSRKNIALFIQVRYEQNLMNKGLKSLADTSYD